MLRRLKERLINVESKKQIERIEGWLIQILNLFQSIAKDAVTNFRLKCKTKH